MHRAADDAEAFATSPEFHERPARATYTAATAAKEPPAPPVVESAGDVDPRPD